jgi:LysM repeat protein
MAKKVKVTVKKGDTLSAIAKAASTPGNKVTVADIVKANPEITNPNKISVNQKITLPPATTNKSKPSAPTSGVVPNFTPTVTMGANTSGQFVGPIPTGTTRTTTEYETVPTSVDATRSALAKLTSGGVLTDAERALLGMAPSGSGASTASTAVWTKAGTVETINGPVDVDANGKAEDGSIPIAKSFDAKVWKKAGVVETNEGFVDVDENGLAADGTKPIPKKTRAEYDAEQLRLAEEERKANERRDAFAAIESTIKSYGFNESELKEINDYLTKILINPKIGPNQALLDMRELGAYKTRFAGNETLAKNGFNRLSEADYLQQEDAYGQKLTEYGVGSLGNRAQFATLIGNKVSVTEVGKRAALAVDRVKNADPAIMTTLKRFYTGITDADLVGYFLNPKEQLPELERRVVTGEIGAASKEYGLNDLSLARAQEFAALGIDQAGARKGYQQIAEKLPRGAQLSAIAPEDQIVYNQALAEDATLKGLASAKRAEEKIKNKEIARFLGSSGAARGAFSTGYLNKSSTAGLY